MVLCVSAIHHPAPVVDGKDKSSASRPFLELTDGWYRIVADIDDCLARAIQKGKIVTGRKLSISGVQVCRLSILGRFR